MRSAADDRLRAEINHAFNAGDALVAASQLIRLVDELALECSPQLLENARWLATCFMSRDEIEHLQTLAADEDEDNETRSEAIARIAFLRAESTTSRPGWVT
jgi:hypothetical protein